MANEKSNKSKARPKEQMQGYILPTAESAPSGRNFTEGEREQWETPGTVGVRKSFLPVPAKILAAPARAEEFAEVRKLNSLNEVLNTIENAKNAGASDWELQDMISTAWSKGLISDEAEALLSAQYGQAYKNYMRKGNLRGKWDWEQWDKKPGGAGRR